jgi:hypothetical protein
MMPDDDLNQRLAQLARADLDPWRSQRLRWLAHRELLRARSSRRLGPSLPSVLEPLLLAGCAAVVLVRLLWFGLLLLGGTV